jgi:hypothetical protein
MRGSGLRWPPIFGERALRLVSADAPPLAGEWFAYTIRRHPARQARTVACPRPTDAPAQRDRLGLNLGRQNVLGEIDANGNNSHGLPDFPS